MVAVVDPRIGLVEPAAIALPHDARANAPTGASVSDHVRLEEASSVAAAAGMPITLPVDPSFLATAHYLRDGTDLLLVSADGQQVVVRDYFAADDPADIVAGASRIDGDPVRVLAGPQAPAQYAQASEVAAAQPIGRTETITGDVTIVRADGTEEQPGSQSFVFAGDVILTAVAAAARLVLADDTVLSIGGETRLGITEFVFDPITGEGSVSLAATNGLLAIISGRIATVDANAITVNTPVASITIRGDAGLALSLPPDGPATLALINSGAEASVDITASNGSATLDQSRETVEIIDGGIPGGVFILSGDQAASLFGGVFSEFSAGLPLVASIQDDAAPFVFQNFAVVDPT